MLLLCPHSSVPNPSSVPLCLRVKLHTLFDPYPHSAEPKLRVMVPPCETHSSSLCVYKPCKFGYYTPKYKI
jgi:hypothetical protein